MIQLTRLELVNFLSHKKTYINFQDYEGLVLIEGKSSGFYNSNGAGKSTILEGILYALTGDTLRGVGVNDVVNRNAKKNTRVSLQFKIGEDIYVINRYRKHEEFGDDIVFIKNDQNISKRVNKDTQALIDETFNISRKILMSTMLLGEGLSSRFTQLSDPEKKNLIESTLNLQYDLGDIRAKANTKLHAVQLERATLNGQIEAIKSIESVDVEDLQSQIDNLDKQMSDMMGIIENKKLEMSLCQDILSQLRPKLQLLSDTITKCTSLNNDCDILQESISKLEQKLQDLETTVICSCELCGQLLNSQESKDHTSSHYREEISKLKETYDEKRKELSQLPSPDILSSKYEDLSKQYAEAESKDKIIFSEVDNLNKSYYNLKYQRDMLQSQIDRSKDSVGNIEDLQKEITTRDEQSQMYEYFYKLFSPTGIITDILSSAVDYINERLRAYSSILLEKEYKISFVKGKISLIDSKGSSYQSLSNGEKRRLDLSIQFALHDYVQTYCGISMDFCACDEILDGLDTVGNENIIEVLRMKLNYCNIGRLFIITHNDGLKDKFDKLITVVKDSEGNSSIE